MKKLNNKGFTIAEVLVSFSLITIILASIISATVFYRDKLKSEEVISQLMDFKYTITKMIYDDIIDESKGINRVERCIGTANCINFVSDINTYTTYTLKIIDNPKTQNGLTKGVYLSYGTALNNTLYMLPDSDLGAGEDRVCDFIGGFETYETGTGLYKVKFGFKHKDIDLQKDFVFIVG